MKLGLLNFLVEKARKIYLYEKYPRTEEQYIKDRNMLLGKITKEKRDFALDRDPKHKAKFARLMEFLNNLVSPLEYEISKRTIEEYKKSYLNLIPEKDWNYYSLLDRLTFEKIRLRKNKKS